MQEETMRIKAKDMGKECPCFENGKKIGDDSVCRPQDWNGHCKCCYYDEKTGECCT